MSKMINLDNIGKTTQKRIRDEVGVKTITSLKKLAKESGVDLGIKKETQEKRAYEYFAYLINENILKEKEKAKAEKIKAEKAKKPKVKKIVKPSNVNEVTVPNSEKYQYIRKFAMENIGNSFQIKILHSNGDMIKEATFHNDNFNNLWVEIKHLIMVSSDEYIWDVIPDVRIFIIFGEKQVKTETIIQSFFEGSVNCVMLPIINFINDKIANSQTKKTISNYNTLLKKALDLETKYHDIGVNNKALDEISNILQIDIHINLPFQKDFIVSKSNKKPLRTFHFINTKLNHVDFDELTHNETEEIVTLQELKQIQKDLDKSKTFYTYTKSNTNINRIDTANKRYRLNNDFRDTVYEFECDSGLINCKLDDINQKEISDFVRQGCHFNETVEVNACPDKYSHIDMKKAYINYKTSKYYEKFVGKITEFRECDYIVGVGFYQIKDLVLNGKVKEINEYLNCYNDNVYFSSELKMLIDEGCTFKIVCGCWGQDIDIDFFSNDNMINSKDEEGNRYYCKYIGQMYCYNLEKSYYIKTDDKFLRHLVNEVEADFKLYDKEVKVSYKKQTSYHLSHICGAILSYMRINMIEQLKEFEKKDIIKIVTDGIFHTKSNVELKNVFINEPKDITMNNGGNSYISNHYCFTKFNVGKFKEYNRVECHIGVGGGGKTHNNLIDNGLVGLCYFAPSWKLARNKQKDYKCNVDTIAKLVSKDIEVINNIKKKYSTFIIDEISMMSEENKQYIIDTYYDCKLIFCGDPNYQLPSIEGNPFNLKNMKVIEYNTNYRVKCDKLANLLSEVRRYIKGGINPRKLIEDACLKGNVNDYDYLNDLIICSTHKNKDVFTEKFKHLNKYYILKSDRIYGRGEIYFDLPDTKDYEIRHAYTVHSIQGETATGKLYIDFEMMYNPQMLYTAISRAQYLNQIVLV